MTKKTISASEAYLIDENQILRTLLFEMKATLNAVRIGETDDTFQKGEPSESFRSHASAETPYRTMIEEMNEGAVTLSADGTICYANRRFAELISVPYEQILGASIFQFLDDKEIPKFDSLLKSGLKEKCKGEVCFSDPNHQILQFRLSLCPLSENFAGKICVIIDDITELQKKEEVLRQSEVKFRTVADYTCDWEYWEGTDSQLIYISPSCERISGYRPDEFLSDSGLRLKIMHPDDAKLLNAHFEKAHTTAHWDNIEELDFRIIRKDGSVAFIDHLCRPIFDSHGAYLGRRVSNRDITDRKLAEHKQQESENRLKEAQRMAHIGNWELDLASNKLNWSDEIYRIFEINPAVFGATHETVLNAVHPDDREPVDRAYAISLATRTPYQITHRLLMPDGRVKFVNEVCETSYDDSGNALRSIGTVQDITERKQIEDELLRKDTLLNLMGTTAQVGGWEFDVETMKQTWTDETYRIHEVGLTFEPTVRDGISFYTPNARSVIEKAFKLAIEQGEPFDLELEFITYNGNPRWVHTIGKAYQENGSTKKVYGSLQDVTRLKQVEQELHQSDVRLKLALEGSHAGAWDLNLLDHTSERSLTHDQIFGYETLLPKWTYEMFLEHVLPEDRPEVERKFKEGVASISDWSFDCRIRRNDGEEHWIYVTVGHILNTKGKPLRLTGLIQDITERKQEENEIRLKNEELKRINLEKDKFFSIIAHDLRSPFNAFLGFTRMMEEELPSLSMEEIQGIASGMQKSATMLFHLLENLLEWSRMQRGLIAFNPEPFPLAIEIASTFELVLDAADKKTIRLTLDIPEDMHIKADAQMFESLMRNLLFNAIKFTPKGGEITVTAKILPDHFAEISIADTGIGMSNDLMDKLFRLDEQTHRKGTEGEPSTGLGLMICKDFIEKHGGRIWVESTEGQGSTFYFTIPCATVASEKTSCETFVSAQTINKPGKLLKILIAEDDEPSEMLISIAVKKIVKEIIKVRTGDEAVAACRDKPDIDLILLDIQLPGMNGYEVTRQIRRFNPSVIIIAQTAYGLSGDSQKAMDAGCNDYIAKPIKQALLLALIQKHFSGTKC